jgi:DNA-binding SARP family transcriptional activator
MAADPGGVTPVTCVALLGRFEVRVDGALVAPGHWARRHAAALVKLLALAPGHHLHREQLIDLLWPDETLDEAAPKLHKAAHFARRALAVPDAIVLRGEQVALLPDAPPVVDALRFEQLARQALAHEDLAAAKGALALYTGELLPGDRYEAWAEERREQLRRRRIDLLRLDRQWEAIVELEPSDEAAHLALMRQYAASGDRHGALRQFEQLRRSLRTELGLVPSREAHELRGQLLTEWVEPAGAGDDRIGGSRELSLASAALLDALGPQSPMLSDERSHERLFAAAVELLRLAALSSLVRGVPFALSDSATMPERATAGQHRCPAVAASPPIRPEERTARVRCCRGRGTTGRSRSGLP